MEEKWKDRRTVDMPKIVASLTDIIGKTPLLRLSGFEKFQGLNAKIIGKLEYLNPSGSIKDRTAWAMIYEAEKNGILKPGAVIIEPTSGNTGIGLASVAAARGYKVILTMPETMSVERCKLLASYGAELVLTEGAKGMTGAIAKAEELLSIVPNSYMPQQFKNQANPRVHYETTGPEIWEDLEGEVDIFVSGVGTGGTVSGAGSYLKSKNAELQIIAVEPVDSPVLSKGKAGTHGIQGIGAGFVPDTLDTSIYDEIVAVETGDAINVVRTLARTDGLLVGISSGAALWAAAQAAKQPKNAGKVIVVILSDTGERYLSIF